MVEGWMNWTPIEANIRTLEKVATTKKEKRAVQNCGAFLGVRDYPPPTLKMRLESFFWNYIMWPYLYIKYWREDRKKDKDNLKIKGEM